VTAVGEVMLEVGAPQGWGPSRLTPQQLQQVLEALQQAAAKGGADATVLRQGSTEMAAEGEHAEGAEAAVVGMPGGLPCPWYETWC
jgi:hypothetical protein